MAARLGFGWAISLGVDSDSEEEAASDRCERSRRSRSPRRSAGPLPPPAPPAPAALPATAKEAAPTLISGLDAADWPGHLQAQIAQARLRLGAQLRPLLVHSAFSGMNSHMRAMRGAGLLARDVAACEPKSHALAFQKANGEGAEHTYDDIRKLIAGPEPAFCSTCCRNCEPPTAKPDLFVAGFSCQAFSPMRGANGARIPAGQHPKFEALSLTIKYIQARKPALSVLENSTGFDRLIDFSGQGQDQRQGRASSPAASSAYAASAAGPEGQLLMSGVEWLQRELGRDFLVHMVKLDARAWVDMSRPRCWIFVIDRGVAAVGAASAAARWAQRIQAGRAKSTPAPLSKFLFPTGSAEWRQHVLGKGSAKSRRIQREPVEAKWKQECDSQRKVWRLEGWAGHDARPLAADRLSGLSGTDRQREILEIHLLRACRAKDLDPRDQAHLQQARSRLSPDVSQNLGWTREGPGVAGVCTSALLFDFESGRAVAPAEILGMMGWHTPAPTASHPSTGEVSSAQLQDLAGEGQALPCLASAIWSGLLAIGSGLPGLWSGEGTWPPA